MINVYELIYDDQWNEALEWFSEENTNNVLQQRVSDRAFSPLMLLIEGEFLDLEGKKLALALRLIWWRRISVTKN